MENSNEVEQTREEKPQPIAAAPSIAAEPPTASVCSVELNKTFTYTITNYAFDTLPDEIVKEIYKDGRVFSHFIEHWLAQRYPLNHISGCKAYDFTDKNDATILYDQKTFTKTKTGGGCNYQPSNMIGEGRKFNKEIFEEKAKKIVYAIVSNVNFPEIKIRFVRGIDLLVHYPTGKIPLKDHIKFFD
jgi:hypothetical protein